MRARLLTFLAALGIAAAPSVPAQAQEWQPLFDGKTMKGWIEAPFGGHGDIEIKDGTFILNQGVLTGVNYTNPIPKLNYEVALEAKRIVGSDFFCGLTFPVKDSFCTLIVGGWGGGVVGLSSLDYADAANNETTRFMKFDADRWYRLRLRVTETNISTWIDDDPVINANTVGKTITLRPGDIELSKPFGIATWSTTAGLRNIRLRSLTAPAAPKPAPAVQPGAPGKPEGKAGAGISPAIRDAAARITASATNTDLAWKRLAELCDRFGPRFCGTTNLESAIDWILAGMKSDGLDNVRGEPVTVRHWVRGAESVELLEPRPHAAAGPERLPMLGLGGSVATPPGGITAEVLVVRTFAELSNRVAEAKGKIVLFDAPFTDYGETVRFRTAGASEAAKAGAVASLIRSVASFSLRSPHTGMMSYADGVPKIPHAALATEDADRLARIADRGGRIVLRLAMSAHDEPPTLSRNVVAEIRGREFPDEIVVVGGHVDSWDVGRGAQDDGGGIVSAWEALRILRQLGLQPRRTIRCVLWTNEEFGLAGATTYRDAHLAELDNHVAAIEADAGTYAPEGYGFVGSEAGMNLMQDVGSVLQEFLGAGKIVKGGVGADVSPLLAKGVPVLSLNTERSKYFHVHHSDADTPDKVDARDLARCSAALAVTTYALAESDTRLPR